MYRRIWMLNILPNFFEPVLYLLSIGIGVGAYITQMGGTSYAAFLAPGLVCVAAMNGASFEVTYNIFVRLNFEKQYDAMLTTPIQPDDVLVGEVLWAVTRSVDLRRLLLHRRRALRLGADAGGPARSAGDSAHRPAVRRHRHQLSRCAIQTIDLYSFYFTLFLTPLFLFSDVFFPLKERLAGSWLWVAEALPLLHSVRLARQRFRRPGRLTVLWDVAYIVVLSPVLLMWARGQCGRGW